MQKKFPRTILLSSFLCLMSFVSHAQWVSIPDDNFGTWLNSNGYSACMQGNNTIGWQMDTTCNAVISAGEVNCSFQQIIDLTGIQYFDNLDTLDCEANQLNILPPLPNSLTFLWCGSCQLSALPTLPNYLRQLSCFNNQLTSLPTLPNSLTYLSCRSNPLTSLPTLPNALTYLECRNSLLSSISSLPVSLTYLDCYNNLLVSLPALPNSLIYLDCSFNQLSSLPLLPNSLDYLDCFHNQLSILPTLSASLTSLSCGYNQLISLPALPNSLTDFGCDRNQLSSLPALPNSLKLLNCYNNQLSSLPTLPNSLTTLFCGINQLSSLPALPNSLTSLECYDNQLNSVPELPDSLSYFNCIDNPNLFCLPRLKKIKSFYFSDSSITCLPNYPQSNTYSYPALDTIPLCDLFNANGCAAYWNISGKIYADSNANCLYDAGENTFPNLKVQLYQNGILQQQQNTQAGGSYSLVTDLGTYTYSIATANLPFVVACPASGYYTSVIAALDSFDADMNFGLRCKPGYDLVAQSISAIGFRPANITTVDISAGDVSNFYNAHCAAGMSGSVQLIINGAAHYVASLGLTPTTVLNDTITWSIADFGAVNFFHDFNINVATDTTAVLGSQICFTLIVNPIAGDNRPANNILTHCFTVVGSFDPNEKEVYPAGNIDTATHRLTYTIYFQNTGTAEAQHIYLTDTLDSNIDAGSFQLLAYSHQPMVQLKGNNLRFNFPNINLPDSNTNEPLSHGYVQYKIKLKDNLPVGTTINNTAFIYFDFNAPVVTNTTSNTISISTTAVSSIRNPNSEIRIYPNPASTQLFIETNGTEVEQVNIYNTTGRLVSQTKLPQSKSIDVSGLVQGVYIAEIKTKDASVKRRWVKM